MTFSTWFTFLIAACVIAISPGSGAVLSMSHGLNYGVKKASGTILGLQAGLLLILAIAGGGVGSILMASELAFSVIKTVGALYLIYLGFNQWRARVELIKTEQASANTQTPDWSRRFLTGFLTNATNPKGIIFMVAVLPQFISHDAPLLPQLLILGITMCSVDLIVMHSYALAASGMQRYFSNPRWLKGQNRFFGGVLMAIGTALFFVKRSPAS
ncbi:LysE family transporter [Undibacterium oligocarboniphilum]|uniref:LysE family transporter n=1 Tax=Undibacterium oligocarboniphilum TaxID=666702 RepID=A0A850QGA5_9BURK|nr:LysE family transporter [Undibacterium oligocarboniphilum]MBC3869638.1 LysE family transporter [Undibacterium oligocarboniphilum]NVO78017.1 LysE family transporter [Undibacterium oligocarboniphilum]